MRRLGAVIVLELAIFLAFCIILFVISRLVLP